MSFLLSVNVHGRDIPENTGMVLKLCMVTMNMVTISQDGLCLLNFWIASQLAIVNIFFKKNARRLIIYSSEGSHVQIDYLLVSWSQLKNIKYIIVICSEEYITQHKLLVCDITLSTKLVKPPCLPSQRKTRKLKEASTREQFVPNLNLRCQYIPTDFESTWELIKLRLKCSW